MLHCPAIDDPKSAWPPLCPNLGASVFFTLLFALTMSAHIIQGVLYRKLYSIVIVMSALWQFMAYSIRSSNINKVTNVGLYSGWFILILLAPLWTNAYVYMVLGRMVYNFTTEAKVLGVHAWRFGLCFVVLDIFAFAVQAVGAIMASGSGLTDAQIMRGLHIYMVGIGLQLLFIVVFVGFAVKARQQMVRENPPSDKSKAMLLLNALFVVLVLIIIRIIFRLIEYSHGYSHGIPIHEAYQYCLDSVPMLAALVILNAVHPGRIMPGKESNLPSRKERKAIGKGNVRGRAGATSSLPGQKHQAEPVGEAADVAMV